MNGAVGLEFPCDYPLKVMGPADAGLEALALRIVRRHAGPADAGAVRSRASRGGRYVALTITVSIESRAQLEAIYAELAAQEQVLMTL